MKSKIYIFNDALQIYIKINPNPIYEDKNYGIMRISGLKFSEIYISTLDEEYGKVFRFLAWDLHNIQYILQVIKEDIEEDTKITNQFFELGKTDSYYIMEMGVLKAEIYQEIKKLVHYYIIKETGV